MFYLSLLVALFLQFILAELLGRSKHIGRWWMFFLLSSTFIIGGLVAWVFSPNAKKEPQKPNKILSIIGVIILILGSLGLVSVLITLNTAFYVLSAPLSLIATGSYLMALGNGRIRNNNPKFYFSWLQLNTSGLLSSFEDALKNKKDEITYYFVKEGENQKGPFTFQELVNARITEETLLWRRGMEKFSRAGDIDELKGAVVYLPPTIDQIEHVEEKMPNTDINPSSTIEQNESVITNEIINLPDDPTETSSVYSVTEKHRKNNIERVVFLYIVISTLAGVVLEITPALFSDSSMGTYWVDNTFARIVSRILFIPSNCLFIYLILSIKNKNIIKTITLMISTFIALYWLFNNLQFMIYGPR